MKSRQKKFVQSNEERKENQSESLQLTTETEIPNDPSKFVHIDKPFKMKSISRKPNRQANWTTEQVQNAIQLERSFYERERKAPILLISFPDENIKKNKIQKFSENIEQVRFPENVAKRYCHVELKPDADVKAEIEKISKIQFQKGFLRAKLRQPQPYEPPPMPLEVDPTTLYVGNLPMDACIAEMRKIYKKSQRIQIGYSRKRKLRRYALVKFRNANDAAEAFEKCYYTNLRSMSLTVRFHRIKNWEILSKAVALNDYEELRIEKEKIDAKFYKVLQHAKTLNPAYFPKIKQEPLSPPQAENQNQMAAQAGDANAGNESSQGLVRAVIPFVQPIAIKQEPISPPSQAPQFNEMIQTYQQYQNPCFSIPDTPRSTVFTQPLLNTAAQIAPQIPAHQAEQASEQYQQNPNPYLVACTEPMMKQTSLAVDLAYPPPAIPLKETRKKNKSSKPKKETKRKEKNASEPPQANKEFLNSSAQNTQPNSENQPYQVQHLSQQYQQHKNASIAPTLASFNQPLPNVAALQQPSMLQAPQMLQQYPQKFNPCFSLPATVNSGPQPLLNKSDIQQKKPSKAKKEPKRKEKCSTGPLPIEQGSPHVEPTQFNQPPPVKSIFDIEAIPEKTIPVIPQTATAAVKKPSRKRKQAAEPANQPPPLILPKKTRSAPRDLNGEQPRQYQTKTRAQTVSLNAMPSRIENSIYSTAAGVGANMNSKNPDDGVQVKNQNAANLSGVIANTDLGKIKTTGKKRQSRWGTPDPTAAQNVALGKSK